MSHLRLKPDGCVCVLVILEFLFVQSRLMATERPASASLPATSGLQASRTSEQRRTPHLQTAAPKEPASLDEAVQQWKDDAFGVFIHWGVSTMFQGRYHGKELERDLWGEWLLRRAGVPDAEYEAMARKWNPKDFNAEQWASLFEEAGFRYLVFVAKHHDGFALFHCKETPYNIVDFSAFGRDPFKELCEAARRHGIRPGFYYSHGTDWHALKGKARTRSPETDAYFEKVVYPHLRTLCTAYGPQAVAWFDLGAPEYYARKCVEIVRQACPTIMISSRVGAGLGNFSTGGDQTVPPVRKSGNWETCMTLNWHWAWYPEDRQHKTPTEIIRLLATVRARGGNLLLNIGPDVRGRIPLKDQLILRQVGAWLRKNGEAIYGTRPAPFDDLPWGVCTSKPGTLYLHVLRLPSQDELFLPGVQNELEQAYFLADESKRPIPLRRVTGGWKLNLMKARPSAACLSEADTVIAVKYKGTLKVRSVPVLDQDLPNRFIPATAKPSRQFRLQHRRWADFLHHCSTMTVLVDHYAGGFAAPKASVEWTFDNTQPNVFCVRVEYANLSDQTVEAVVKVGANELSVKLPPTVLSKQNPECFRVRRIGWTKLSKGQNLPLVFTVKSAPTPSSQQADSRKRTRRRRKKAQDLFMLKAVTLESAYPPPYMLP